MSDRQAWIRGEGDDADDRGQLVLVAAAAIALALFPLVLAYLQLGYAGDVATERAGPATGGELDVALEEAVHGVAIDVDGRSDVGPEAAATAFRSGARADLRRLETARVEEGTAARIEYAPELAEDWVATGRWRSGVADDFARPTVHGGVIVQERAGEPVVLAVAFDVHLRTPEGTVDRRFLIRVPG